LNVGDFLRPSFALDSAGIEKMKRYPIEEISESYIYVRTGFSLLFPIAKTKIVEEERFMEDVEENYRSRTWLHTQAV
jgi:hypothetical protein